MSSWKTEEMGTAAAFLEGRVNKKQKASRAVYCIPINMLTKKDEVSSHFSLPHIFFCFNHCLDQQKSRAWALLVDKSAGNDANPKQDIHYGNHGATKLLVHRSAATTHAKR